MVDQSLGEIVRSFQSGSRDAFAILVSRFQNLVTSVAFANTGDIQRSEDLAQQAFLTAWQKQGELRDPERFGGWMRSITTNLARNERRLKENIQQKLSVSIVDSEEPSDATTPDQVSSNAEQKALLWSTLDQIPIEYREPLILFYREDHSVVKVAELMGLSEDVVKQRLKRGRAMVKREIETMVDQFLVESRPSSVFSSNVMAALPAIGVTAGTVAAKAGGVIVAKTGGAKIASWLAVGVTGAGIGVLGGLLGLLGGLGGAWIGTRTGIKNSTSEEEANLHRSMFKQSSLLSLFLTGGVLIAVFGLQGRASIVLIGVTNVVFFAALGAILYRFITRQKLLHQKYGVPEYMKQHSSSATGMVMSTTGVRFNAIAMIGGMWMWLIVLTSIGGAYWLLSISLVLLAFQIVSLWLTAPAAATSAPKIMRFNGRACLLTSVMQFSVVMTAYFTGVNGFAASYQGVPIWCMGLFVLAIGGGVAWFVFRNADRIERSLESTEES